MGSLEHTRASGRRTAGKPWWPDGPTSWRESWPWTRSCLDCSCWMWSGRSGERKAAEVPAGHRQRL